MEHKILYFDESAGKLTVCYNDLVTITVDIPIEEGKYVAGVKLTQYLISIAPVWEIERLQRLKTIETGVNNVHEIRNLVSNIPESEAAKSLVNDLFRPVPATPTHEVNHKLHADKEYLKELIKEILDESKKDE